MLNQELISNYSNKINESNVILFKNYRIIILTDHIIRIEKSFDNKYIDNPTEMVINRNTSSVNYKKEIINNELYIKTKDVIFKISNFNNIKVSFDEGKTYKKDSKNLKGTRTTLDMCFRKSKINKGIMSKNGVSIIKDNSMIFNNDGTLSYRKTKNNDLYVFASLNYKELLKEYFTISGNLPMIPRYSFGNWWSRYWKYSEKTYLELMDKFKEKDIPLSVSVIDAEWHYFHTYTDLQPLYNFKLPKMHNYTTTGWTGYTFNKNLFPDPKRFLDSLKERGLKATLNLHMNEGVLPHEDMYQVMKDELGTNGKLNEVKFDIGNPKFVNSYFNHLMHPLEEKGVDFFWLDWQQWKMKKELGVDPLFSLNHYHYLDNSKNNKRGLILSRYSGLGSHRYPIGFSGDTFMNWPILNFIPYFTTTATNVGYELWSHDIGGHMLGYSDDELYTRWIEFGCFSPINRLHSSNVAGMGKEPWAHSFEADIISRYYLRLRNKLIPYMYDSYYKATNNVRPLIEPLYYEYNDKESYKDSNSYLLGESLLIHPMTTKRIKFTHTSIEKAYLPTNYIDIFSKELLNKGIHYLSKELKDIPVLLKESSILPLSYNYRLNDNPDTLEIISYSGNAEYHLFEDDGLSNSYKNGIYSTTNIYNSTYSDKVIYKISINNPTNLNMDTRNYIIKPLNIIDCKDVILTIDNNKTTLSNYNINNTKIYTNNKDNHIYNKDFELINNDFEIIIDDIKTSSIIEIEIINPIYRKNKSYDEYIENWISKANCSNISKLLLDKKFMHKKNNALKSIKLLPYNKKIKNTLKEIINISE